ncbi:MAG: sodium:alanine symporter family protein, partial [Clostridia bacterium]|nr:sodium:alanine symporter family protein [Clostridia bacterium]
MPVFAFIKDCLSLVTTALLLLCGLFLCVRLRAFALLHPGRVLKVAFKGEKNRKETVKAFTLALAGTLGVGNIAGVALAIFYGGAGALFWMWVCGIFAMFLKYAEISLALADKAEGGNGFGYIARAFGGKKAPLALFAFAMLALSFSMGAMIQSNAIASTASANLSISPILTGVLLFLLTFAVIFGGLKRISSVTLRLIPLASALYVAMCLLVLFCRFDAIGDAFARIFASAFESRAGVFGVLSFLFGRAFRQGGMCGLLSNEAGCGTAPLAHATASGAAPARQAVWGIFEVFADTMILCTLTGLTLLVSMDKVPMGAKGMEAVCA